MLSFYNYGKDSIHLIAIIFVGLISTSKSTLEHQMTSATKNSDKDHSNSRNEHQDKGMSNKNNSSADIDDDDGDFASVFDGKTLDGWKMAGDGTFRIVESDTSLQSEGGMGLLWYSERIYNNFILKLEWKVSDEGDNSGVFVRFPDPDDNPNIAVREGYEIQIDDKADNPMHQTGAIYDFATPNKIVSKSPGQWNTMEIQTQDQSYTVVINGHKVTEFTGSRMTEGYIGLQAHDDRSKVSFRNILINEVYS
jgi:Domain of Unknown Function (DUF1080)